MAAATAVSLDRGLGPESRRSTSESELWSIPASTAADTCAITTRNFSKPRGAIGFAGWSVTSISANVVNFVCDVTTSGTSYGEIIGDN